MKYTIDSVTHVARYGGTEFYLIADKHPVNSLKYTLGRCIAQNENFRSNGTDSVSDEITVIPIDEYTGEIKDNFRVFRDENDMTGFFVRNT